MRARLRGGLLNAAQARGVEGCRYRWGWSTTLSAKWHSTPTEQVQHSLRLLFDIFSRTGSARATVKAFPRRAAAVSRTVRVVGRTGVSCIGSL